MWNRRLLCAALFCHCSVQEWSSRLLAFWATWFPIAKMFFFLHNLILRLCFQAFHPAIPSSVHAFGNLAIHWLIVQQALIRSVVWTKYILLHKHSVAIWNPDWRWLSYLFIVFPSISPPSFSLGIGWLCGRTSHLSLSKQNLHSGIFKTCTNIWVTQCCLQIASLYIISSEALAVM